MKDWEEISKQHGTLHCQKQDVWCCYTDLKTGDCTRGECIYIGEQLGLKIDTGKTAAEIQGRNLKLLIGGSPCTHWSIAQTKNRETEPSGIGWELFLNYKTAVEKFKPDYFLYENNKSMSTAIRAQITKEFWGIEPVLINSALVSAQNRQRLYWVGRRNTDGTYSQIEVRQPEDKGIVLADILQSGFKLCEKGYALKAKTASENFQIYMIAEPINATADGKAQCLRATCYKDGIRNMVGNAIDRKTCVAMPVRIGTIENDAKNPNYDSQGYRVYSPYAKSVTLKGQGGGMGAKTGLYAVPVAGRIVGRRIGPDGHRKDHSQNLRWIQTPEANRNPQKTNCLTTVDKDNVIIIPLEYNPLNNCNVVVTDTNIRCAYKDGGGTAMGYTVMFPDAKSQTVTAGQAQKMKIIEPAIFQVPRGYNKGGIKYKKSPTLTASAWEHNNFALESADGKTYPVYRVMDGQITIKDRQYPIKLPDGFYIIRKLTVAECKRLQTVPDSYIFPVSNTQSYKMLGNGWTVDVIAHILSHIPEIKTHNVEVLSMYDGMSCGHIALDKLGATISKYYATEIDKYAIQTTQANYPDTIQLGDAFKIRERSSWEF